MEHFKSLWLLVVTRKMHTYRRHPVVGEETLCAVCCIYHISFAVKHACRFEKVDFRTCRAAADEHCLLRHAVAYRKHGFQNCLGSVVAYAANLAGR